MYVKVAGQESQFGVKSDIVNPKSLSAESGCAETTSDPPSSTSHT